MALPFSYAARNLARSPSRSMQIVIGSALVVLLILMAAAFNHGLERVLVGSGDNELMVVMSTGSEESLERSQVDRATVGILTASVGGLREQLGVQAVSPEVHFMGLVSVGDGEPSQTHLRGVDPPAFLVHQEARIMTGRFPGPNQVLVGVNAHHKLGVPAADLAPGQTLQFENRTWTIAGTFEAPGTIMESEIWMPVQELMDATRRETLSGLFVDLGSATRADLETFCFQRFDLELTTISAAEYYSGLAVFYEPIRIMAWITAALIGLAALFGGLNTLYAAFAERIRELAMLQAMGFSRWSICRSLLTESLLATLTGTVLAIAIAVFFLDGLYVPFSGSVFALRLELEHLTLALGVGIGLGLIGVGAPAWRCLAPPVPAALRSLA